MQRLYEDLLDHPLSHKSEMLLHTTFAARHSDRELLGRFLAAVDRRDGAAAAALFADAEDVHAHNSSRASSSSEGEDEKAYNSCMWQTNTLIFGDVIGKAAIQQLIERQLPPNKILQGSAHDAAPSGGCSCRDSGTHTCRGKLYDLKWRQWGRAVPSASSDLPEFLFQLEPYPHPSKPPLLPL